MKIAEAIRKIPRTRKNKDRCDHCDSPNVYLRTTTKDLKCKNCGGLTPVKVIT